MELSAAILFITFILRDRTAWRRHPALSLWIGIVFLTGLHPAFDEAARYSVWLHSLQSLMLHHLGPLLVLLAGQSPKIPRSNMADASLARAASMLALLVFVAMTLLWISPALHVRIMENAALYSLMKWGMAISGIVLSSLMARQMQAADCSFTAGLPLCFSMAVPQIAAGLYMILSPPLYPMGLCHTPALDWLPTPGVEQDQQLGGVLLVASASIFLVCDLRLRAQALSRTAPSLSVTTSAEQIS